MFKSTYLGESYWFDNFEEVKNYYNHPEAADADELNSILKAEAEGMESPVISEIWNTAGTQEEEGMANTRKLNGHDIDWTAKETIRDAREAKGISRAELSRRLEIPIRTLENWDAGVNEPPAWAEKLIIEKIESM